MNNSRRKFIRLSGMAGLAVGISGFKSHFAETFPANSVNEIRFISPIDGDMLNRFDGSVTNGNLMTNVQIAAPEGSSILINGSKARYINGIFQAGVRLKGYKNIIRLEEERTGYKDCITVYWLKNFTNKYRLSLDDNIWFLKDIYINTNRYKSIFENPYLRFLKEVHDNYGTKIHINIYYETDGFNISQLSDRFKSEWRANSGLAEIKFPCISR